MLVVKSELVLMIKLPYVPRMRGGRLWPQGSMQGSSHNRSRAFAVPREDWLGGNSGEDDPDSDNPVALEAVPGMHSTPRQNCSLGLAAKWWWPFGSCGWVHERWDTARNGASYWFVGSLVQFTVSES